MMFYLLSLITGVLECGWIAFGAIYSLPLWQILCYPLAYHIGNLFPMPVSLSKDYLRLIGIAALICSIMTFIASGTVCIILTCIALFGISAVIQSVRGGLKNNGNRLMKRVFRVGGFAFAPLAALIPSVILIASAITALYALKDYSGTYRVYRITGQDGYSPVMIFHQLHYFFYAHITLAAMNLMFVRDCSVKGVVFGAILFCGTWVTYMSVEPIVSKLTAKTLPVFYTGHIGLSILLFTMSFVTDTPLFIVLWLVTGFAGGVVYTITARAKHVGNYDKVSMTISENIGHTLGLLSAVGVAAIFGEQSPHIMLVFGAASAALAVIFMTFISRKESKYEVINNNG